MLWKAAMVSRSVSMVSPASSMSQLGMKPTTSASTGSGVGSGVGAGRRRGQRRLASARPPAPASTARRRGRGVADQSLSTVMQALATKGTQQQEQHRRAAGPGEAGAAVDVQHNRHPTKDRRRSGVSRQASQSQ